MTKIWFTLSRWGSTLKREATPWPAHGRLEWPEVRCSSVVGCKFNLNRSLETRYAAVYNGSDIDGMENSLDYGAWGHPLLDQTTVQAASIFTPLGPWATCMRFHST